MKLFVDTWGWLTLRDRGEAQHREVVDFYNDLSTMVVMEELGVSMILTGDVHFIHVGMGFQIVP